MCFSGIILQPQSSPFIPLRRGTGGIRVKLRNSWDDMDCTDALTGHLYVCPCLLVIHKSTKVTGGVADHCPPLAGD